MSHPFVPFVLLLFVCLLTDCELSYSLASTGVWAKQAPGWKELTDSLYLDYEITQGLWEVLHVISACESDGVFAYKNEVAKEKAEAYAAAQKKWRDDLEAKNAVRILFLARISSCLCAVRTVPCAAFNFRLFFLMVPILVAPRRLRDRSSRTT
jgi:hypothetical protein